MRRKETAPKVKAKSGKDSGGAGGGAATTTGGTIRPGTHKTPFAEVLEKQSGKKYCGDCMIPLCFIS